MRMRTKSRHVGIFSILLSLLVLMFMPGNVGAAELELIKPSTLVVAFNGDLGRPLHQGRFDFQAELIRHPVHQFAVKTDEPGVLPTGSGHIAIKGHDKGTGFD